MIVQMYMLHCGMYKVLMVNGCSRPILAQPAKLGRFQKLYSFSHNFVCVEPNQVEHIGISCKNIKF